MYLNATDSVAVAEVIVKWLRLVPETQVVPVFCQRVKVQHVHQCVYWVRVAKRTGLLKGVLHMDTYVDRNGECRLQHGTWTCGGEVLCQSRTLAPQYLIPLPQLRVSCPTATRIPCFH